VDIKNTIKSIVIILLFISTAALAGLNIYQNRQIQELKQVASVVASQDRDSKESPAFDNAMASRQTRQQDQVVSGAESQTGDGEVDELLYQLDAAEEELAGIREEVAADEAKKAKLEELQKKLSKMSRQILPSKESIKANLEYQYADLYKKLNLTPEQIDEFKGLQAEQELTQQDVFSNYNLTGDMTEEEREEMSSRLRELHEESESEIEAFLGKTEYEAYQLYSETQGERYRVKEFMGYLDSGETLSEPQKESLIEAMNEELRNVVSEGPRYTAEDYSNMSNEEKMEMQLASYTQNNEAYLKAAKSVLSAAQVEKFEVYLEEETERNRLFLEMSVLQESNSGGGFFVISD